MPNNPARSRLAVERCFDDDDDDDDAKTDAYSES